MRGTLPPFPRMELANCLLECCTTDSLKPAEARSEKGGDRWRKKTKHLLAPGWPPTNTHGREEKQIRAEVPCSSCQWLLSSMVIHREQ